MKVAQGIFNDDLVFGFAEKEANAGLIVGVFKLSVNSGEIKIHLASKLRLEGFNLKVNDNETAKFEMIKKQINVEVA